MQALKIATIVMGVIILAGIAVIAVTIVRRLSAPAPSGALVSITLEEPAGTHIVGLAATADRLAVELQGGGPDRVLLIDPRNGVRTGRITLGH